ncbi:DUF4124 domain-containing protein [Vibrio sp. SCSIO 43135]|uniref:DUF4124 domain-containing protein n=1 Tax=Vibrio sp. SCSIO 43135 TaxID=2819096 RepID=UPI002074E145|nr:DUF4124 domain-containing protein [Vibrio sp. SCSIO 43135]USD41206.1 DUF4124 domain-containing protein [Vibrio sp. SCSIO 43135]
MKLFHFTAPLLITIPLSLSAQDVFTWEDDNGVIHFGDSPQHKNAKLISLPDHSAASPAPTFEQPEPVEASTTASSPSTKSLAKLELAIESPVHDQTIRSNQGFIAVTASVSRKLAVGEQLQLLLDGNKYGAPQIANNWQLKNIDRGTHTLSIQSFRGGKLIASSDSITVHLHRTSLKKQ